MSCSLYRHFDEYGVLLYVGISINPLVRSESHKHLAPWFAAVRRIEIEVFPDMAEAREAERLAVQNEKPLHNKLLQLRPPRSPRPPRIAKQKATQRPWEPGKPGRPPTGKAMTSTERSRKRRERLRELSLHDRG